MSRFGRAPVRAARRDANEPPIVAALQAAGAAVQQLDPPLPDLLVSYRGQLFLVEVKRERSDEGRGAHRGNHVAGFPPSLTPQQVEWWRAWRAAGGRDPAIALDAASALAAIGASSDLPPDLLPDAIAVARQRAPRIR